MRRIHIVFCILFLTTTSCMKRGDIAVHEVGDISIRGFSGADVALRVENRSSRNLSVTEVNLSLERGGRSLMNIFIPDRVFIARRSDGFVTVPLRMEIKNPLAVMALSLDSMLDSPEGFTVSGEIVVNIGHRQKKLKLREVPLERILREIENNIALEL